MLCRPSLNYFSGVALANFAGSPQDFLSRRTSLPTVCMTQLCLIMKKFMDLTALSEKNLL